MSSSQTVCRGANDVMICDDFGCLVGCFLGSSAAVVGHATLRGCFERDLQLECRCRPEHCDALKLSSGVSPALTDPSILVGAQIVAKLYQDVIDDVIKNMKQEFENEGIDDQILLELQNVSAARRSTAFAALTFGSNTNIVLIYSCR